VGSLWGDAVATGLLLLLQPRTTGFRLMSFDRAIRLERHAAAEKPVEDDVFFKAYVEWRSRNPI
jgi:hypothetical protein